MCLCVCTHMCARVHIHSIRRCKCVDVCMHGYVIAPLSKYRSLGVSAYLALPLGIYVPVQLGKEPEPRLGQGLGSGSSSRAFAQEVKLMETSLQSPIHTCCCSAQPAATAHHPPPSTSHALILTFLLLQEAFPDANTVTP